MAEAKRVVKSGFLKAVGVFFDYDTPKIVHIRSKKVGVINRIIQLAIIGYIVGYAIVWQKGYQDFDNVESATTTKLKGVVYATLPNVSIPGVTDRIYDVADYVVPPQENDAFFVTTNIVYTANQNQSTCDEDPSMKNIICKNDSDCKAGTYVVNGNGMRTGKCIDSTRNSTIKVCEIYAWCPVEVDELPDPTTALLSDAKQFTVLIKNSIEFPKFNVKRRNVLETQNPDYLKSCRFNSSDEVDQLCPIFEINTILKRAGEDFDDIAVLGGLIAISIEWDCNLDFSIEDCIPKYDFRRLDVRDAKISKGWNFRYANYYDEGAVLRRDLIKAYGLRFVIKVGGRAGKFSVVPLLLNLGSGIGLLAIATVLCDIIVLYVLKKGPFYKTKKYKEVVDDDAFQGADSDDDLVEDADDERPRAHRRGLQSGLLDSTNQPTYDTMGNTDQEKLELSDENAVKNRRTGSGPAGQRSGDYTQLDD